MNTLRVVCEPNRVERFCVETFQVSVLIAKKVAYAVAGRDARVPQRSISLANAFASVEPLSIGSRPTTVLPQGNRSRSC
jgi:hypothetical protein